MAGGESEQHWQLKAAGLRWLAEHRYSVRAAEIRLPNSGFRADVVGYRPAVVSAEGENGRRESQHQVGVTVVLECKQARSDFLKDTREEASTRRRLHQCL